MRTSKDLDKLFDSIVDEATTAFEAANMFDSPAYIADNGRFVSHDEYMLELYERALMEAYEDDDEEEIATEGATIDSMKVLHKFKKEQKKMKKIVKKSLKRGEYDKAKKQLDIMSKLAMDAYKEIDSIKVSKVSVVCGQFAYIFQIAFESLIVTLPIFLGATAVGAGAGAIAAGAKGAIVGLSTGLTLGSISTSFVTLYKSIIENVAMTKEFARSVAKGDDKDDQQDANFVKNRCKTIVKKYQDTIKEMKKDIDKYAKEKNEEEKKAEKEEKIKKESTEEYQNIRSAYEAYNDGLITLDQREELIHNIKVEAATNSEILDIEYEPETEETPAFNALEASEKFDRVRKGIYKKYSEGTITLDQREEMLATARSIILEAGDEKQKQEAQKKLAETEQNAINKDTEKVKSELEKTAAEITKDSNK